MKRLLGILAISSIYLGGCAFSSISHGTEITEQQLTEINPGVTTKKDIYKTFGEPTKSLEGGSLLFFSWTRGGSAAFLGMGSTDTESKSLMVEFDDQNVVKDYRLTRGSPVGSN
jgi:outer membrane protein assembly factor BamE (lipoprotein component of BamABCDE complex)|tara:strand:+ start:256 stop:597 length:342 start_codon:yes stop_codon:yes gene_type:complete